MLIRVGVIGYGTMGQVHSEAIQKLPDCELTVVADVDPDRRAQAQRDYGVDVVCNVEEVLAGFDVDLVDICVPTYLHESIMVKAMEGDKHIFCEKPLARSLEEGRRLVELSTGYKRKIGIGHALRFCSAYLGIRESVLQGEVGDVGVVRTFRGGSQYPKGWHDWFADFDLSGGVILDLTYHDLDFLRWLFGDVERVYAKSTHGRSAANLEWAMIVLRFKSGVIAHVEGSWTNFPGEFYTTMEMAGKNGLISYDSRATDPIITVTLPNNKSKYRANDVSPYYQELLDMVQAIKENRPPLVTVEDAFGSLQVALAAVESAKTGQVITL